MTLFELNRLFNEWLVDTVLGRNDLGPFEGAILEFV
jgi:hypothetical protein